MENNSNKLDLSITLKGVRLGEDNLPALIEEVSASLKTDVTDSSLQNWHGILNQWFGDSLNKILASLANGVERDQKQDFSGQNPSSN